MADSPAILLFRHALRSWGSDGWSHSWTRLNTSLGDAVSLAIRAGLAWNTADWATMQREAEWHIPGETDAYHSEACRHGNRSAADSIDAAKGRKAIKLGSRWPEKPERFHLRRVFVGYNWFEGGEVWYVTSFADDGESVTACTYHPHLNHSKIKARRTFDRAHFSPPKPKDEEASHA